MDALQQRANQVDQKLKDLDTTLHQLQRGLPTIKAANASLSPTYEPRKRQDDNDVVLTRADALKILKQLKSIKQKVLTYEDERLQEKQNLAQVRDKMRTELLALKKQLLVDEFRQTPEQFRAYLQTQLSTLKQELVRLQNVEATQSAKPQASELDAFSKDALKKVKAELIGIRKEMALKLSELKRYQEFEAEFDSYKKKLNMKLLNVKQEVESMELELNHTKKELKRVQNENDDYRKGNRIPKLLQNTITSKLSVLKEQVFKVETENKTFRMQSSGEDPLLSISSSLYVTTVDMHTGGEPLRIIQNGIPSLAGPTLLDKRQCMISNMDHYRRFLMHEPRGHFDMYGVIITEPDDAQVADFAVLFMHNEGYSSMCGHAIIALGRYAVDFGLIQKKTSEEKQAKDDRVAVVRIQCPCGIVTAHVEIDEKTGKSRGNVSFISAPGWAEYMSTSIQLDQFGKIEIDIGYGGAYYAICPATRFNLNVRDSSMDDLVNISMLIKQTVIKKLSLSNPDSKDLEFLYGTILTDGINEVNEASANVCVFADRQVDRCPTGSGVVARLAIDYAKKNIKVGQKRKFIGKTGSIFSGEIVEVLENYKDKKNAVMVKVTGAAKYIGRSQFYLEEGDELGRGFLMK